MNWEKQLIIWQKNVRKSTSGARKLTSGAHEKIRQMTTMMVLQTELKETETTSDFHLIHNALLWFEILLAE